MNTYPDQHNFGNANRTNVFVIICGSPPWVYNRIQGCHSNVGGDHVSGDDNNIASSSRGGCNGIASGGHSGCDGIASSCRVCSVRDVVDRIASSIHAVNCISMSGKRIISGVQDIAHTAGNVSGVHNVNGTIAGGMRINSSVPDVHGIACNVRVVSAVRFFRNGNAGGDDGVVNSGVIAIDGCIVGGVPDDASSGLDIGGVDVATLVVSLVDNGLCDGAAFAFVSSPPHVLWL